MQVHVHTVHDTRFWPVSVQVHVWRPKSKTKGKTELQTEEEREREADQVYVGMYCVACTLQEPGPP